MNHYPFPVGAHSYFKVRNLTEARSQFIEGKEKYPEFQYGTATPELIARRLNAVEDVRDKERLELVLASLKLRETPNEKNLVAFRALNETIYGLPTKALAAQILQKVGSRVKPGQETYWDYISDKLAIKLLPQPASDELEGIFTVYRDYFERYAGVSQYKKMSLRLGTIELISKALEKTGLAAQGWQAILRDGNKHARTVYRKKFISLGRDYIPRSNHAKLRIMVHEVFGHAFRGPRPAAEESEGFATVLEQLTKSKYTFRRSYRYLAVALGWGVFGKPMDFREVYEIIWRSMTIMSSYPESVAKRHAFDECARAFRGGLPSMQGAVFLKDAQYFSANLRIWEHLSNEPVSYEQFVAILEGRRALLK